MRTPRRMIEAMCPRHRACDRWPVTGTYNTLIERCSDCMDAGRAIQDESGLWLRLLADLPDDLVEHQAATHEAAHAVVGLATGHPLVRICIAEKAGGGEGAEEPAGAVTWGPWEMALEDHLAMVWAGQDAGLRWLRENDLDVPENRIDVLYGSFHDACEADAMTAEYRVPGDLGRQQSTLMVARHWRHIRRLAGLLVERRDMAGSEVRAALRSTECRPKRIYLTQ